MSTSRRRARLRGHWRRRRPARSRERPLGGDDSAEHSDRLTSTRVSIADDRHRRLRALFLVGHLDARAQARRWRRSARAECRLASPLRVHDGEILPGAPSRDGAGQVAADGGIEIQRDEVQVLVQRLDVMTPVLHRCRCDSPARSSTLPRRGRGGTVEGRRSAGCS